MVITLRCQSGEDRQASLQAFERVGLVRTLAEPNLTTVSGEAAKFLAGGEFPVPSGEDSTATLSRRPSKAPNARATAAARSGSVSLPLG